MLDLDVEAGRVHLVLTNCGDAVATNVGVEFSRPLIGLGGSVDVSELPVFKRLGVLRPGRTLRIFWDAAAALGDQAAPFSASVSWSDRSSRARQRVEYEHDPSIYVRWPECVDRPPR